MNIKGYNVDKYDKRVIYTLRDPLGLVVRVSNISPALGSSPDIAAALDSILGTTLILNSVVCKPIFFLRFFVGLIESHICSSP